MTSPFDKIRDAALIERMSRAIRGLDNAALGPEKSLLWRRHAYEAHQIAIDPEDFDRLDKLAIERNEMGVM